MQDLLDKLQSRIKTPYQGVLRLHVTDRDDVIDIDGHQSPPIYKLIAPPITTIEQESTADSLTGICHWVADYNTYLRIFSAQNRQIEAAFMAGRLKIHGDMAVMTRLTLDNQ